VQVEPPAMQHTRDRAPGQGAISEWRTGMRAHVFHGVKLSLVSEEGDIAITHMKFTSLPFRDIVYTGKSDGA